MHLYLPSDIWRSIRHWATKPYKYCTIDRRPVPESFHPPGRRPALEPLRPDGHTYIRRERIRHIHRRTWCRTVSWSIRAERSVVAGNGLRWQRVEPDQWHGRRFPFYWSPPSSGLRRSAGLHGKKSIYCIYYSIHINIHLPFDKILFMI